MISIDNFNVLQKEHIFFSMLLAVASHDSYEKTTLLLYYITII